jgi:hypothetical protein
MRESQGLQKRRNMFATNHSRRGVTPGVPSGLRCFRLVATLAWTEQTWSSAFPSLESTLSTLSSATCERLAKSMTCGVLVRRVCHSHEGATAAVHLEIDAHGMRLSSIYCRVNTEHINLCNSISILHPQHLKNEPMREQS